MTGIDLHLDAAPGSSESGALELFRIAFADIAALAFEKGQLSERARQDAIARDNFRRYFTPAHADIIARDPAAVALGGDTRQVAVLFSDLRGFTSLAESQDPATTAKLLSDVFGELVECVLACGGTVDKFMGDSVMALWGAPISAGDEADRAVEAAVAMMSALDGLNARWAAAGEPALGMGIGLGFGEVFAGNIGGERRREYTVIGDVVNTASRLCAAAGAGEILASDDFRRALRGPWLLTEVSPLTLKGKRRPIVAHRVSR